MARWHASEAMNIKFSGQWWFNIFVILSSLSLFGCANYANEAPVDQIAASVHTPGYYRVKTGDTLYSIAWAYGLDYRELAHMNQLHGTAIQPGEQLLVTRVYSQPRRFAKVSNQRPKTKQARLHSSLQSKVPKASRRLKSPTHGSNQAVKNKSKPTIHRSKPRPKSKTASQAAMSIETNRPIRVWRWPVKGKKLQGFAPKQGYKGIDIAAKVGTPVRAAAKGRVVYAGTGLRAYGKLVIIKHNDAYLSAYAHNRTLLVHEGQTVKSGQVIAKLGQSGAKRPMLHFEIRRNGQPVNPLHYLTS